MKFGLKRLSKAQDVVDQVLQALPDGAFTGAGQMMEHFQEYLSTSTKSTTGVKRKQVDEALKDATRFEDESIVTPYKPSLRSTTTLTSRVVDLQRAVSAKVSIITKRHL
jgi:hypothetical protein